MAAAELRVEDERSSVRVHRSGTTPAVDDDGRLQRVVGHGSVSTEPELPHVCKVLAAPFEHGR